MKSTRDSERPMMDRRQFVKVSALAGGGLLVGTYVRLGELGAAEPSAVAAPDFTPNAFISISSSGAVSTLVASLS